MYWRLDITEASSEDFIKAIAPKYAVICCGKDNKYGHPHKETVNTLNKYKVTTYRTDLNGNVIVTSDGKKISVKLTTPTKTTEKANATKTNKDTGKANAPTTNKTNNTDKKQATTTTQPVTQTVYITKTGKKYHKDGCSYLKDSKIAISLDDAKAKGYEPCSKCCK